MNPLTTHKISNLNKKREPRKVISKFDNKKILTDFYPKMQASYSNSNLPESQLKDIYNTFRRLCLLQSFQCL